MSVYVLGYQQFLPTSFEQILVSELQKLTFFSGIIELDETSPYYPNRSDLKIMRKDVIASVIAAQALLENLKIGHEREDFSLFVASGAFVEKVEKHLSHVIRVYEEMHLHKDAHETMQKLYKNSPPLLALQTLTNSAMSFISQYTGIKGNNATFGTNSVAGFHALEEAIFDTEHSKINSLVSTSNMGGAHSFLMNSPLFSNKQGWKEGEAAACLLLSNDGSNQTPVCKITNLKTLPNSSHLKSVDIERRWHEIIPPIPADGIIFSGAFTPDVFEMDQNYCNKICVNSFSLYKEFGNLGCVNPIASIIFGIKLLQKEHSIIDILDRDVYGNQTVIRIEKV